MSQFQCPLCGKYSSYSRYDPTNFGDDIRGVDFVGLGKEKGFRISARYSLLNDDHLRGLIVQRSRRILWFIEGSEPVTRADLQMYIKSNNAWAKWGAAARSELNEKNVIINSIESQNKKLRSENNALKEQVARYGPSVFAAETEQLQRTIQEWVKWGEQTKRTLAEKDAEMRLLRNENLNIKKSLSALREQLKESDEESVYASEAEGLLEKINVSCNTDYDDLSEAIDFLLE